MQHSTAVRFAPLLVHKRRDIPGVFHTVSTISTRIINVLGWAPEVARAWGAQEIYHSRSPFYNHLHRRDVLFRLGWPGLSPTVWGSDPPDLIA